MPNQHTTRLNHIGQRFGKLLVIAVHVVHPKNGTNWLCLCDCGNTCTPRGDSLRFGSSRSCGCDRRINFHNQTHGKSHSPTYQSWLAMKQRCYNPRCKAFPNYGGRGITVCERWFESFENFYADMGECPEGRTIERRDNESGYSPENCHWETRKGQQRNRRVNRYITAFNQTKTVAEWSELSGLKHNVITRRLSHGYTSEEAVSLPPFSKYKRQPQPPKPSPSKLESRKPI